MEAEKEIELVFKYLKEIEVYIDRKEFLYQINSHPDYPSLLAVKDTLDFISISNSVLKVDFENFNNLPSIFISLINEIDDKNNKYLSYFKVIDGIIKHTNSSGEEKIINKDDLETIWTSVVFVITENSIVKKPWDVGEILSFNIIILFLIFTFTFLNFETGILIFMNLIGLYFSTEAIKIELGINSIIKDQICNTIDNTDCEGIINSNLKLFGKFKFNDLSFLFFSTQVLSFVILGKLEYFQLYIFQILLLITSIPITIYSIYYQGWKIKKWCPICICIIIILYIQILYLLFLVFPLINFNFPPIKLILLYFVIVVINIFSFHLLKTGIQKIILLRTENNLNLKFIKNYHFFKLILTQASRFNPNLLNSGLSVGNINSKLCLTVVYSPFCSFCSETHLIISKIFADYKEKVNIQIRFNLSGKNDGYDILYVQLHRIYKEEGSINFMIALETWFKEKDLIKWIAQYSKKTVDETKLINEILIVNYENYNNGIYFTPYIMVNGYEYPFHLNKKYLLNYLPDLIEDSEDLINTF